MEQKLCSICREFGIDGAFVAYEEISMGNVNCTYKVDFVGADGERDSYMVQSLNTVAFRDPVAVMENIDRITAHILAKQPAQATLHFCRAGDGNTYFFEGPRFWRIYHYVPSVTYNSNEDLEIVRSAGEAFGKFQMMLNDFDARQLHETIPNFHNTCSRYEKLEHDAAENAAGRLEQVREELDWLLSVREQACSLVELQREGKLPLRVTHNDTKINNVLFDPEKKQALVVIDLDTVMPGLVGFDFGDAIRFAANRVAEDSRDYEHTGIDLDTFRAFTEGFLSQTREVLTQNEIDTLADSCFAITCELAVRFLSDYLEGDVYFRTRYPEHNLDRTRCQIALAKDIWTHLPEMKEIVCECVRCHRTQ